jgi:hypothetical protein
MSRYSQSTSFMTSTNNVGGFVRFPTTGPILEIQASPIASCSLIELDLNYSDAHTTVISLARSLTQGTLIRPNKFLNENDSDILSNAQFGFSWSANTPTVPSSNRVFRIFPNGPFRYKSSKGIIIPIGQSLILWNTLFSGAVRVSCTVVIEE